MSVDSLGNTVGRSIRAVAGNPRLLRIESGYACFCVYEQAVWVVVLFWAFATGGPGLAGFVAVVQLVPASALAPVGGMIGDRIPRDRALGLIYLGQAIAMGALAVALVEGNRVVVVAVAVVTTTLIGWSRPSHYAAAAEVSATPQEAAASNSLSGTLEGTGYFVGPILAGFGATLGGTAVVVAGCALLALVGSIATWHLGLGRPGTAADADDDDATATEDAAGWRSLLAHPAALAVLLLVGVEFLAEGSLELLSVAYAHDHLQRGSSAAGLLIGSLGAGATVGAALTIVLAGWRRLSFAVAGGLLLAAGPLLIMPFLHALPAAIVVGCVAGVGQAFFAVSGITLLQRAVPDAVMARILSLRESALLAGLAVGAALVPLLIHAFGSGGAYAALGLALCALAVIALPVLVRLDREAVFRPDVVELLRGIPFLEVLDIRALERLAHNARESTVAAGTVVIRQGDVGDLYYLVSDGQLEVRVSGRPEPVRLGPGDGFGEIALLRDVPRTATVVAMTPSRLFTVGRRAFLDTLAGSAGADLAARHVDRQLNRPGLTPPRSQP